MSSVVGGSRRESTEYRPGTSLVSLPPKCDRVVDPRGLYMETVALYLFLAIYSSDRCSASSRVPTAAFIPARASWPHDMKKLRCTLFRPWALRGRSAIDDPISGLKCGRSAMDRAKTTHRLRLSVNYKTRPTPFVFWQMVGHTRWPHCCWTITRLRTGQQTVAGDSSHSLMRAATLSRQPPFDLSARIRRPHQRTARPPPRPLYPFAA